MKVKAHKIGMMPIVLAYVAYPVVNIASRVAGLNVPRNWIDIVWLCLALCSAIVLTQRKVHIRNSIEIQITLFLFVLLATVKAGFSLFDDPEAIAYLMEVKPLLYLGVALLIRSAFGLTDRRHFVAAGKWLAYIAVIDFLMESLAAGRFIKPLLSGEPNYDACLLLVSFALAMNPADRSRKVNTTIIALGILATLSRTTLVALVFITFLFGKLRPVTKLSIGLLATGFVVFSFQVRELGLMDVEDMDRYWMWVSAFNLLQGQLGSALFGYPIGVALPVNVPQALEWLWESQQEGWGIQGIYPFNFHAFWLRLTISWGTTGLFIVLTVLLWIWTRRQNAESRSLVVILLFQGLTMGLFYLSNVAIPLYLALFACARKMRRERAASIIGPIRTRQTVC